MTSRKSRSETVTGGEEATAITRPDGVVDLNNWDFSPYNRWSFQHVREVLPTVAVPRGDGAPRHFDRRRLDRELGSLSLSTHDGRTISLDEFLDETYTDGFLVIHNGIIVYERYMNSMTESTLHLSQSVAKSIVSTTTGALIGRGELDPSTQVESLVPELANAGHAGATLGDVLDMRSGVSFTEDYDNPESDIGTLERVTGWKPRRKTDPATTLEFIAGLRRDRAHGGDFEYRSIETEIIALMVERTTGRRLADVVSRELWSRLRPEHDASFTVDHSGHALADGGFNATLRDYGRLGQLHVDLGRVDDEQVVSQEWIRSCRNGDHSAFKGLYRQQWPNGAYRNQFWIEDTDIDAYSAVGIFGQQIHIDPTAQMVVVKLSSWPQPLIESFRLDTYIAMRTLARTLSRGVTPT